VHRLIVPNAWWCRKNTLRIDFYPRYFRDTLHIHENAAGLFFSDDHIALLSHKCCNSWLDVQNWKIVVKTFHSIEESFILRWIIKHSYPFNCITKERNNVSVAFSAVIIFSEITIARCQAFVHTCPSKCANCCLIITQRNVAIWNIINYFHSVFSLHRQDY